MNRQEAIKVVRDNWPEGRVLLKSALEILIPELKESKEEKIRKSIIEFLKTMASLKDGKTVSNEDFDSKALLEWADWLEKQGLLNNDKYQTVPVEILDRLYESEKELERLKQKPFDYENANIKQKAFAPKIEPKFKVGDWIVYCNEDVDLITGIEDKGYIINKGGYIPFTCEGDMRYWTIQDARDGDVLISDNGSAHNKGVFIFRKIGNYRFNQVVDYYVGYSTGLNTIVVQSGVSHFGNINLTSYKPTTKEQCDFLFQKMKEAGYEWDAEKKELKKIEQNPVEPVTVMERDGEKWVRVCAFGEDFIIAAHDYRDGDKTEFTWEEACKIGTFSKKQGYIILALLGEINAKLKEIGGEPLSFVYWSSSEYNSYNAWYVAFHSGTVTHNGKSNSNVAREVIAF